MTDQYAISGVDLTENEYEVEQALLRNKYKATNAAGEVVLRGKQKMLKMKEDFPFENGDGEHVFSVKAGGVLDFAGNYTIVTAPDEEPVAVLDANYQFFGDTWKVRDPHDESLLATITSKSTVPDILRSIHGIFKIIPHKYEIQDADGTVIGEINGQFSLKDRYTVRVEDTGDVPREPVIAAAMVIDAIEGN